MKAIDVARRPRLVHGVGAVSLLPGLLVSEGYASVIVVTGGRSIRSRDQWAALVDGLLDAGVEFLDFTVRGEPSPERVDEIVAETLKDALDVQAVVGIGGGSVIDAAKAAAAMIAMSRKAAPETGEKPGEKRGERPGETPGRRVETAGSTVDYLEGVGSLAPTGATLPLVAVPTTAGTGSEATKNAVLSRTGPTGFKRSLRHDAFIPSVAILDPELHRGQPRHVTQASGLDAVTQLLEAFVSTQANPVSDAVCREGLRLAGRSLPDLIRGSDTTQAREDMALAAHFSGIALASAGLGLVHGFASTLGAAHEIPHGVVCALLVGPVTAANIGAAREDSRRDTAGDRGGTAAARCLERYGEAAVLLVGEGLASVEAVEAAPHPLAVWLSRQADGLGTLADYGFVEDELAGLASVTGLKNNPVNLSIDQRLSILRDVLGGVGT